MSSEFKAILLAAGLGKRLRPLTLNKPKCLMEINKVPLLKIWLEKLVKLGCGEVLINTHYLAEQVKEFIEMYKPVELKIKISHEKSLLGTAGTLIKNIDFADQTTLLMHTDNFTNCNLEGLLSMHKNKQKNCLLTMLTFNSQNPSSCGIVETDKRGVLQYFHEKVKNPPSNIANGAIYVFDSQFISWLKEQNQEFKDFSKDVIPCLTNRIQTWHTNDFFIDIGTPDSLMKAQMITKIEKD